MDISEKIIKTRDFYRDELTDMEFYFRLSKRIKDPWLKQSLERLSAIEKEHSEFWKSYLERNGENVDNLGPRGFRVSLLLFLHWILGTGLTAKIMEHGEVETVASYRRAGPLAADDPEFKAGLEKIIDDEVEHEDVFSYTLDQSREQLERNRNVIYGISDGLVEVLAALAGLTAIISDHIYVAMGGLIVGVSGAMSMSVGAYLATNSEAQFKISQLRRNAILNNEVRDDSKVQKYRNESRRAAINTGMFYILGAAIPIIPFLFLPVLYALILSVILVAFSQAISNSIVAISMNMSVKKEALKSAALALLAAFGSFLVGQIFHLVFHISII